MSRSLFAALIVIPVAVSCQPHRATDSGGKSHELDEQLQLVLAGEPQEIIVRTQPITDADFSRILTAKRVVSLDLYRCRLSGVTGIEQLGDLQRLRLEGFACDDAAAREISHLGQVSILNLPDATFGDAGLAAIATLPNLELLRFGSENVTDEGLACLADVKSLRFLHLIGVPLTDRGLEAFRGMSQLESLYIDGGRQTDEGIRLLLKANPQLHFHRDQLHLSNDPLADGH